MKVLVSQLIANMYRDMDKYPIDRKKVDGLKESIQQTSFWDNLMARPAGNVVPAEMLGDQTLSAYLDSLEAAFLEDGTFLFPVELAYGHHRWVAIQELGYEEISIPVKAIEDQTMLQVMANENKGDWASNMSVILETVRQARQFLLDSVAEYDTFDLYKAAGNSFFAKEQFAQIGAQGIGFKPIQKFLGDTWSDQDVRKAVAVLKDVDAGLYAQEQIVHFPSVGVLGGFSKLANSIAVQPWPAFFKESMITDIAIMISDDKVSTTVKILTQATSAAKDGKDPVRVIRSPGQKRQDFNVVKAVKDLCYENMDPNTLLILDDLPELDGFKDYEGLADMITEVRKSIARTEAAKKAIETGETQTTEDGEEISPEMAGDQDALESMVSGAEAEVGTQAAEDGTLGVVAEGDANVEDATVVVDSFIQSAQVMTAQVGAFTTAVQSGNVSDDDTSALTALDTLAREVLASYLACFGPDDTQTLVDTMVAEVPVETVDE